MAGRRGRTRYRVRCSDSSTKTATASPISRLGSRHAEDQDAALPRRCRGTWRVPPPAPLPVIMTSKRLSMVTPSETNAAVHDAAVRENRGRGQITRALLPARKATTFAISSGRAIRPSGMAAIELHELGRICHGAEIDRRRHWPPGQLRRLESCGWPSSRPAVPRQHCSMPPLARPVDRIAGHRPSPRALEVKY